MVGILVEKPSAARNFAKALGGISGTYNNEAYTIVNSVGHLYEFVSPEKQVGPSLSAQYKSWNLTNLPWNENDFNWKRAIKKDMSSVVSNIKKVLSGCSEIIIATDVDPTGEGELLAWEILDEIGLKGKTYSRMYFMDESVSEIQKAFKTRKSIPSMQQDMDFAKAYYRSKWDFLSMQFTRIATACGDGRSVLRQGRLKSTMVLLTGDGLKAVKEYKKIPFYQNKFKDENGNIYSNPDESSFSDKTQVPQTYTSSAVIVDSKEMKSTAPPKLLDLAALSSRLSSKGIKAKEVLSVYQKMYEAQIVSYPRTEDKVITPEQFNELLPLIDDIASVVGVDSKLLTHRTPRKTHVKTGGAHGANRPGLNVPKSLDDLKQYGSCAPMIYEILARNYLATVAEDYEYEYQKGHLEKYPAFTGSASIPKKMGYKAVFSDDNDDDSDDLSAGKGLGTNASPYVHEGFPPKPPAPTMKWLMKQLEKHDVGTGATRTNIYAEVTNEKAKYPLMAEKKGKLSMTQYGDMSYLLLKDTNIGNVKTTEQLMSDMRDIAAGKLDPDACLHRMQQMVISDMEIMKRNSVIMRKELGVVMQTAEPKEKVIGVWSETGQEVSFNKEWGGHEFTKAECDALLSGKEITITGLQSDSGDTYGVVGKLSKQTYKGHEFVGFEKISFVNADGSVPEKKADAERCTGKWKGEEISFKREWRGHRFTDSECKDLLAGKEIQIFGLKSSKSPGKTYGVRGKLTTQTYKGHEFVGFESLGFASEDKVPDSWCKHKFTDDEKIMLESGKKITIEDAVSAKSGRVFSCDVSYGERDDGTKGIIPHFNK